jgi:hypothetical protein
MPVTKKKKFNNVKNVIKIFAAYLHFLVNKLECLNPKNIFTLVEAMAWGSALGWLLPYLQLLG